MPVPWPTFDHSQGDSLTNLMLITSFYRFRPKSYWEPCNKFGSLSPAKNQVEFKLGTFWFWLQHLNPLDQLWPSYFVDVVVWPKFGNSNVIVREVIITQFYTQLAEGFESPFLWRPPILSTPLFKILFTKNPIS